MVPAATATALAALLCVAVPTSPPATRAPEPSPASGDAGFTKPRAVDPDCIRQGLTRAAATQPGPWPAGRLVTLELLVQVDGVPSRLEFPEGRPEEPLASSVEAAVRGCRFEPARRPDGAAMNTWVLLPLRFEEAPPSRRVPWGWLAAGIYAAYIAAFVVAGILLSRRLGLSGRRAPPRETLPRPDYLTRRSLRALLAFDFLVILPIGSAGAAVAALEGWHELLMVSLVALLPSLMFLAPIPFLLRMVRADDRRRAAGLPPPPNPAPGSYGHPGLDAVLGGRAQATVATVLLVMFTSAAAWGIRNPVSFLQLLKDDQAIRSGEVGQFLSAVGLVHTGFLHLVANSAALLSVGVLLERLFGVRAYLLVLLASGVSGGAASALLTGAPAAAVSGGVFGLAGALVAFGWRHQAALPEAAIRRMGVSVGSALLLNLALTVGQPPAGWAAQLGGLVLGVAMGWSQRPSPALAEVLAERAPSFGGSPPPSPLPPQA